MSPKRPAPTGVAGFRRLFRAVGSLLPALGIAGLALGLGRFQVGAFLGSKRAPGLPGRFPDLALFQELDCRLVVGTGAAVAALALDLAVLFRFVGHRVLLGCESSNAAKSTRLRAICRGLLRANSAPRRHAGARSARPRGYSWSWYRPAAAADFPTAPARAAPWRGDRPPRRRVRVAPARSSTS